jgi:hypothetical protein
MEQKYELTETQLRNLLKGDIDTVAEISKLIETQKVVKWEDLETVSGYYFNSEAEIDDVYGAATDYDGNVNIFAKKSQALGFVIAAAKLTQVVERARDGWKPNWSDWSQTKFMVDYEVDGGLYVSELSNIVGPFALPTRELAEQLLETCREDLESFFTAFRS